MQKSITIALLINPFAGKRRIQKIAEKIVAVLTERQISFTSFTELWPDDINFYKEAWIIGGDGTMNYFLNFYKAVTIPIVIFKGGTGNDFAWKLYGDMNVSDQIKKALIASPKYVDAGQCNGRIFINGVGIGFDGEVLKSMNAIRLLGGHLGYLWIVLKKIFSFKEGFYQIRYDDSSISQKYLLVMITNSTSTGGGFIVSPEAKIDDGKLNMVLCKQLSVLKRLKYLPVIEKGKHLSKDFILHKEIKSVTIICEKETLAQIDGELISSKIFNIDIFPVGYLFKY